MKAEWTENGGVRSLDVTDSSDALKLLAELSSTLSVAPAMVEFFQPGSGRAIAIGVGRPLTVVTYQDSLDPPYFISIGDLVNAGNETFLYGEEESEYLGQNLIAYPLAVEAVRDFFKSSGIYEGISWERL